MTDSPLGEVRQAVRDIHVHYQTSVGDQPARPEQLTAEDWDAARRALGPGSRSLLFGTSTKILDSITQRFKQQAPSALAAYASALAAYAEVAEAIRQAAEQGGYVILGEETASSTFSPSDTYDGSEPGPKQVPLEHIRDLTQQVLREVFERIEEKPEENKPSKPPSS